MSNILITGGTGFVGSHLIEYILSLNEDHAIYVLSRWRSDKENIKHLLDKINLVDGDLLDQASLMRIINNVRPDKIFHLAAQSYVPASFNAPSKTMLTNVIGTTNLLESIIRLRDIDIDPVIMICSCHDTETQLVTKRGVVAYTKIKKDDLVLSINPVTSRTEFKPIKKIIINEYKGLMKKVNTRSVDFLVTPNHKMIFSKKAESSLLFDEIRNKRNKSDRMYFPKGKFKGKKDSEISIGGKDYPTKDIFYFIGLYLGVGYSGTQKKKIKNSSGLNRSDFLKKCRDGGGKFKKINKGERGTIETTICHSHRVFLAIPKEDKSRKKAIACIKRLGFKCSEYDIELYFSSKDFVKFLDQFTHSALTKFIPDWLFEYDSSLLEYLYKGLIDSDGHYVKTGGGGQRYHTSSKKLRDSFIVLCLLLGKHVTVCERGNSQSIIKGRKIKSRLGYCFSITNKNRSIEEKNITNTKYNGITWCLEIEDNHNFAVFRNGKINFSGNSSEVYGQVTEDEVPICENNQLRPASPYAVSKATKDFLGQQYYRSYGLKTFITRAFTHSGPRRNEVFFISAFAKQIARIEKELQEPIIKVGNLESVRTICDVRDMVAAYWLLSNNTEAHKGEVFNIGGTESFKVGEILDKLIEMSPKKITIKVSDNLLRPSDVTLQIPNCAKFTRLTGWKQKYSADETITSVLYYWREKIK